MVKVLRSFVRGPLDPPVVGFAEELPRRGYSRSAAAQHVCFIAHLNSWMSAEGVELDGLSAPLIERYLAERRLLGAIATTRSVSAALLLGLRAVTWTSSGRSPPPACTATCSTLPD